MKGSRKMVILGFVAAIIVIFIISTVGFSKRMTAAKDAIAQHNTMLFESTVGTVEYTIQGDGFPVVVAHGITGGVDQSEGIAKCYLSQGYKVISVSRFGYLQSDMPDNPTAALQADVFSELLNMLGIKKAIMVAHSAGAPSAFEFAAHHKDQCESLIILSGAVPREEAYPLPPKGVIKTVFSSNYLYYWICKLNPTPMLKQAGTPVEQLEKLTAEEKRELLDSIVFSALPINKRTKGVLFDMYESNINVKHCTMEDIKAPTLLVVAADDTLINFKDTQRCADRIDNSEYIKIEKGGHLFLGSELDIQNTINDFLKRRCQIETEL